MQITHEELAILSTAIAIVQKHAERMRGQVLCADGKMRRLTKEGAVNLIDRLSQLAGHAPSVLKEQALAIADEVARHG